MKLCGTFLRSLGLEANAVGDARSQTGFGILDILAAPQDLNDQIDDLTGFDKAFLNLPLLLLFCQQGAVFPGGQFVLKFDIMLQDLAQT